MTYRPAGWIAPAPVDTAAAARPLRFEHDCLHRRPPAQGRHPAARGRARRALVRAARHDSRDRGPRLRFGLGRRASALSLAGPAGPRTVGGVDAALGDRRVDQPDRARAARRLHELPQSGAARQAGRDDRRDQRRPVRAGPRGRLEPDRVRRLRLSRTTTVWTASRRRSRSSRPSCATAPSTSMGAGTRRATASSDRAGRDRPDHR